MESCVPPDGNTDFWHCCQHRNLETEAAVESCVEWLLTAAGGRYDGAAAGAQVLLTSNYMCNFLRGPVRTDQL